MPVSFPCTNHLNHVHTESRKDVAGKSTLDWSGYWIIMFPSDSTTARQSMAPACRVTRKIHVNSFQLLGSSCSFAYGGSPSCNERVAIPQPQLTQAQELSQTYPCFVLRTTLFHGLLNRIPKMSAEQASLYYGLQKS